MYHTIKAEVHKQDSLYDYCDRVTKATNNLRNATLFRIRQVLTMVEKPVEMLTDNERAVCLEIQNALSAMNGKYKMPVKGKARLSYSFLLALFAATKNPDYYCANLSAQTAQHTVKSVVQDVDNYFAMLRKCKAKPEVFAGKPKLPGYSKSGGNHTATLTNQDCVLYCKAPPDNEEATWELKLPLIKQRLNFGNAPVTGRLKQVTITPAHGIFIVCVILDDGAAEPQCREPKRICAIDLGVDNFAAITNNSGLPCLLFKGGAVKSINQYYNKRMAEIQSRQTNGTTEKFKPTRESENLCLWRSRAIDDFCNKVASQIIQWCIVNHVDTVVVGTNTYWKQKSNMGAVNNQNFVQLPFDRFRWNLRYRTQRAGINYVEQEESYTSRASFVDGDYIPTYGVDDAEVQFSGLRGPTSYNGKHRPGNKAYRGIYRTGDGEYVNSDLNGSANIGRKAFPELYAPGCVDFHSVEIVKHPDCRYRNTKQPLQRNKSTQTSKSKQRRLAKKNKK